MCFIREHHSLMIPPHRLYLVCLSLSLSVTSINFLFCRSSSCFPLSVFFFLSPSRRTRTSHKHTDKRRVCDVKHTEMDGLFQHTLAQEAKSWTGLIRRTQSDRKHLRKHVTSLPVRLSLNNICTYAEENSLTFSLSLCLSLSVSRSFTQFGSICLPVRPRWCPHFRPAM